MEVETEMTNNVMCLLTDPEGTPLGAPMYLPQNAGPQQLQQIVNKLLNNEEKLPYAFYISDQELLVALGTYLEKHKVSVEKVLSNSLSTTSYFQNSSSESLFSYNCWCVNVLGLLVLMGDNLASGSGDTTVRIWDLNTQTPMYTCTGHKNWVLCIAWSPDGKHPCEWEQGWRTSMLGSRDRKAIRQSTQLVTRNGLTGISWEPIHLNSPSRRFVSSSKDGDARIWDITLRKCVICLSGHTLAVTCVKWGGDGVIYTGSQDCTIKVWETTQGKLIRELKVALERYNKMKGNAPERLVSGSDDFTMFLWEPAVSKHPKTRMTGHQQLVNHVYFSPDGQWVASASFDKSVKLWNGTTGKFVAAFRGHVGPVYQISWSADSRLLLSGSKDSTLKVWDIRTQKLKQDLPGHADEVFAVDWSPDGEKVASGGKDRVLKLWMG
ncbi:hypothetical protein Pint_23960 [Pistacia integerrima]|uniref:Uncharacterized protein n=1 Tax=Pistacia integerrima TaxID=434235 RepID=A0ACC0YLJ4_9ROSI|nr:hypothetical protein Pint_23960 [Pistacia integerrima]